MVSRSRLIITKLDAARQQLRTAIRLWFKNGDPVAIHTLAFAAYEIIHVISKKRNPGRRDLIFDALIVKDEFRSDFNKSIKKHAAFFKHAKEDWQETIEFVPALSTLFLTGASAGLRLMGEHPSVEETALLYWFFLHEPHWLTSSFRKRFEDSIPIKERILIKGLPKLDFFEAFLMAQKHSRGAR